MRQARREVGDVDAVEAARQLLGIRIVERGRGSLAGAGFTAADAPDLEAMLSQRCGEATADETARADDRRAGHSSTNPA